MEELAWLTLVIILCMGVLASTQNLSLSALPTPTPPAPTKRFGVQNSKGEYCVVLEAAMVMFIKTPEDQEDISLTEDGELDSESHCNASVPSASLVIDVKKDQFNATVDFQFTGSATGSQYWTMNNVNVSLNASGGDWNMFTASNKLYQEANSKIEWGKSFSCAASQNLTFTEVANITLLLGVSELKVQAFQFKNAISEEFDDARVCLLDNGDRVVAIAVGAALAGLAVVVIIVYIIGRIWSRRHNDYDYEPFSEPLA